MTPAITPATTSICHATSSMCIRIFIGRPNNSNHRIGSRGAPGAHAAGVPRVPDTVDCGVPPPPTPPGFAPLPNSPVFIAICQLSPATKSPGLPGRIAILQPPDHSCVFHTQRIQSLEEYQAQLPSHRKRSELSHQTRLARNLNPNGHGCLETRGPSGGTSAMSGPRPEARQVRTQLACRGSAVRSIAWFGSDCPRWLDVLSQLIGQS